jgi:hypothetical protein
MQGVGEWAWGVDEGSRTKAAAAALACNTLQVGLEVEFCFRFMTLSCRVCRGVGEGARCSFRLLLLLLRTCHAGVCLLKTS